MPEHSKSKQGPKTQEKLVKWLSPALPPPAMLKMSKLRRLQLGADKQQTCPQSLSREDLESGGREGTQGL